MNLSITTIITVFSFLMVPALIAGQGIVHEITGSSDILGVESRMIDGYSRIIEPPSIDFQSLAMQIVEKNAGIRNGERVWIKVDGDADPDFINELAVAVGRAGGHPVVTQFSNAMLRGWYREVPGSVDARPDPWLWKMYETADVLIEIEALDYSVFFEADEERLIAWEAANGNVMDVARERGMRVIRFGNSLYPVSSRADMLGVSNDELAEAFWAAVMTDPNYLTETGADLRSALESVKTIRITDPNGTDLTMRTATRSIVVTDGTTNRKPEPGELNITWLPGGEVTLGIDPGSVQGRLAVERVHFDGEELRVLEFIFDPDSRVTIQSESDFSRLKSVLDLAPPGLDRITGLKIGINPAIHDWRLLPYMGSGIVSVSLGANRLLGGDIELPFILFLSLKEATLFVDGYPLIEDGKLKL